MDSYKHIGYIKLEDRLDFFNHIEKKEYSRDLFLQKKGSYRISAQVGLWRKDYLLSLLRRGEDAWDFEFNASYRCKFYRKKPLVIDLNEYRLFNYFYGELISNKKVNNNLRDYYKEHENIIVNDLPVFGDTSKANKSLLRKIYEKVYRRLSVVLNIRYYR